MIKCMSRFIETVRFENRLPLHIFYHNGRLNDTRRHFYPGLQDIDLDDIFEDVKIPDNGRYKCRVLYGERIDAVEVEAYTPRSIGCLKAVEAPDAEYTYKYSDRSALQELRAQSGECEDIIITQNGYVTDTSFSNIACLKNGEWYTPSTFLLNGTMRQMLLDQGQLRETEMTKEQLPEYEKVSLINTMLDPGDLAVPVENIRL